MRLAYLDAHAGISGDMLLGAFVHAGVPRQVLQDTLAALDLGASLSISETDRSGIHAIKVSILVGDKVAETIPARRHATTHIHANGSHHHHHGDEAAPHEETAPHHHHEHRSLPVIRGLIERAALADRVKERSLRAFELLAAAEAKIHHVPVESIHFHEVGAVDAIADIVLVSAGAEFLQIDAWHCSPLNVGGGTVECAHGRFPVPAPATADLLRGVPTYSSGIEMELVTPTGAALVRALDCQFGPAPAMKVSAIGYGAGTRNPAGFANVLRLSIGESEDAETETIWVLEAALDDLNPQIIGYVVDRAFALGALDVMSAPVSMKKNRPGTLVTLLSDREHRRTLEDLLLRETSTLGLRVREERRVVLDRTHVQVATPWGPVRVKVGSRAGVELNAAPEFEECRTIAEAQNIPLKLVLETALRAYREKAAS
jgi:uncharacterized protein (TIGR00299 family) protein